jgi:hypothetical protein
MRLPTTARITTGWAALFALVHFYWAAGGVAGMNGNPATTAPEQAYIGFVALLGLVGAFVAASFQRGGVATTPRRRVVLLARLGGGALLAGVVFGTGRWLAAGDLGDDGAAGVFTTAYFLVGGILFVARGRLGGGPSTPARTTRPRAAAA